MMIMIMINEYDDDDDGSHDESSLMMGIEEGHIVLGRLWR